MSSRAACCAAPSPSAGATTDGRLGRRLAPPRLGARPRRLRARRAVAARRGRRPLAGRAARRPGLLRARGPRIAIPPDRCSATDGMLRAAPGARPRCCRSGPPARSPPCTPPGCRRPTARTSRPWRRSRTPTPGSSERVGWLNRLVGTGTRHLAAAGLQRRRRASSPTSLVGPQPTMSAGRVDDVERRRRRPTTTDGRQRRRSLQTLWDGETAAAGRRPCASTFAGHRTRSRRSRPPPTTRRRYPGTGPRQGAGRRPPGSSAATSASR